MSVEAQVKESIEAVSIMSFESGVITALILYSLFLIKHFLCDFPLQSWPYMYNNKGTYGHPGGLLHAFIHGLGTFITLLSVSFFIDSVLISTIALLSLIDILVHYHIDWAKMSLNKYMGWTANNSNKFWILLGFDQLLHSLTYLFLVYFFVFGF